MAEEHVYRGYRLVVAAEGERWRVEVYTAGSRTAELVVTSSGASAGEDAALDDARHVVDRLLDAQLSWGR